MKKTYYVYWTDMPLIIDPDSQYQLLIEIVTMEAVWVKPPTKVRRRALRRVAEALAPTFRDGTLVCDFLND